MNHGITSIGIRYYGKGLVAKKTYEAVYASCKFPAVGNGRQPEGCEAAIETVYNEVGPHDVYDIYDNCPSSAEFADAHNLTMRQLLSYARARLTPGLISDSLKLAALDASYGVNSDGGSPGGYEWSCDGMGAMRAFFKIPAVQQALHLDKPEKSRFGYDSSGPASVTHAIYIYIRCVWN